MINFKALKYVIFTLFIAASASAAKANGLSNIKKIVEHYKTVSAVSAKVDRQVKLSLLDENKSSEGSFLFSKGNLRLEIEKPDKSLIVMNKKTVWVVTPTSKELGGQTQVLKINTSKNAKSAKAPIAALLMDSKSWDAFKVKNEKTTDGVTQVQLIPQKPDSMGDVVLVDVKFDKSKREIKQLSYKDELDNETIYIFKDTNFKAEVDSAKFQYAPPSNAEVTEY